MGVRSQRTVYECDAPNCGRWADIPLYGFKEVERLRDEGWNLTGDNGTILCPAHSGFHPKPIAITSASNAIPEETVLLREQKAYQRGLQKAYRRGLQDAFDRIGKAVEEQRIMMFNLERRPAEQ